VPRAVYSRLRGLADPAYSHRYTVDGPVLEGDVWDGSVWKTIVVGTTGAGPAGLYAIDITAPQSGLSSANVLWDITPADHPSADVQDHLGSTIGLGAIGSVRYDLTRRRPRSRTASGPSSSATATKASGIERSCSSSTR
jgi:Tfp pilus tip-associated adhesin PilY1